MGIDERVQYLEMKARHQKKLRPWYKKPAGIILIIFIVFIVSAAIVASIYIFKQVKIIQTKQGAEAQTAEIAKITAAIDGRGENYSIGPINAKVKIVIFSDYACPYCQQAAPVVRNLAAKYGDKIRITFRDYPLHENSVELALAGNCAGEQGKFWEMNDLLFEKQDDTGILQGQALKTVLNGLTTELKLDEEKFNTCLDNKTYLYRLNDDFADAELLGLAGTPSWFINRYKITGFYPEENFINMIDGLLAQ
jgi:protein-disulfide isomerase